MRYRGNRSASLNTFLCKEKCSTSNWMNSKRCQGAKQRNVGDKPYLPALNARLLWAQEAGSNTEPQRRQHTHMLSPGIAGLLWTCWSPTDPRWVKVSNKRSYTIMLPHLLTHLWTWHTMESMDKKRQGHLHKDPSNVLPRLSFLPWSSLHGLDPYRKQSEPGRWHLRWVHNRWVHKQPPKVIKYYFL